MILVVVVVGGGVALAFEEQGAGPLLPPPPPLVTPLVIGDPVTDKGGPLIVTGGHPDDTAGPLTEMEGPLAVTGGPFANTKGRWWVLEDLWLTWNFCSNATFVLRGCHDETTDNGRSNAPNFISARCP